jgi:flagellar basal body rod protein FlgB
MLLNAYERNSNLNETDKSQTQETKKSKKNALQADLTDSASAAPVNGNHVPAPSEEISFKRVTVYYEWYSIIVFQNF